MLFKEAVENFIKIVNNESLTNELKDRVAALDEANNTITAYRELQTILLEIIGAWNIDDSSSEEAKTASIAKIKNEFLALIAIPSVLENLARDFDYTSSFNAKLARYMLEKINAIDPQFLSAEADSSFYSTFFANLLNLKIMQNNNNDAEFVEEVINFIAKFSFMSEPACLAGLSQVKAKKYDPLLTAAVWHLLKLEGVDAKTVLMELHAQPENRAFINLTRPTLKMLGEIDWFLNRDTDNLTEEDLKSNSKRIQTISIANPDLFVRKVAEYADRFADFAQDNLSSKEHKQVKRLGKLLNLLTEAQLDALATLVGKEAFLNLSLAIMKSYRDTYRNQANSPEHIAKRMLGRTPSDAKKILLEKMCEEIQNRRAEFLNDADGEILDNENFKHESLLKETSIIQTPVFAATYKEHYGKAAKTKEELDAFITTVLLKGIDCRAAFAWAPPTYSQAQAQGTILLTMAEEAEAASASQNTVEGQAKDGKSVVVESRRMSVSMLMAGQVRADEIKEQQLVGIKEDDEYSSSEDEDTPLKSADEKTSSSFGAASSTVAGKSAKQAEQQTRNKSMFSVFSLGGKR